MLMCGLVLSNFSFAIGFSSCKNPFPLIQKVKH